MPREIAVSENEIAVKSGKLTASSLRVTASSVAQHATSLLLTASSRETREVRKSMDIVITTLRWPSRLHKSFKAKAEREGISLQGLIVEILLERFGIRVYRVGKDRQHQIDRILRVYDYVPKDIAEAVKDAKFSREHRLGGDGNKVVIMKSQQERMEEVEKVGKNWNV